MGAQTVWLTLARAQMHARVRIRPRVRGHDPHARAHVRRHASSPPLCRRRSAGTPPSAALPPGRRGSTRLTGSVVRPSLTVVLSVVRPSLTVVLPIRRCSCGSRVRVRRLLLSHLQGYHYNSIHQHYYHYKYIYHHYHYIAKLSSLLQLPGYHLYYTCEAIIALTFISSLNKLSR